ncbi:MAG: hypothetical protein RLO81_11320 [Fulvivirga sp.]|uniref:hypothetical protein n=1 Tax=Fulvivirga sp. TaxID=1931237 RepID=UPI0032F05B32
MKNILIILFSLLATAVFSQVYQTHRYELEKKNNDDFFTVLPVGDLGVIIYRDTDKYKKGNVLHMVSLDTTLTERWSTELSIDTKLEFKGFDITRSKMYLLFRDGQYEKNDYHLMAISVLDGEVTRYDIKNEIALELSHMAVLEDGLILAGYVNLSPTLVSYKFGEQSFEVVQGFFKDRSNVVDLRDNGNSTFNVITLEKDYVGSLVRLRTYSYDGELLFEREVKMDERYHILSAKSSGFIDGNIIVAGTYGMSKSYYSSGLYIAVVKPAGQDNIVKFHNFFALEHFFDYMKPKRAARIKAKMKRKSEKGKDVHYSSRLLLHEVRKSKDGYLLAAEIFDPDYITHSRPGIDNGFASQEEIERRNRAAQRYSKQPSKIHNVDDASSFEYLESIVVGLNKSGDVIWDNSLKIKEVETYALDQIVQVAEHDRQLSMLYRAEETINFKTVQQSETIEEGEEPLKLKNEGEKIVHTYRGAGRSEYWYDNNFIVWGYHKIDSEVETLDRRNVLYINKVVFK